MAAPRSHPPLEIWHAQHLAGATVTQTGAHESMPTAAAATARSPR